MTYRKEAPVAQAGYGGEPGETTEGLTRRLVLRCLTAFGVTGAGVALCGARGTAAAAADPVLAHTSDIPVGGGKVLREDKIVVTQPTKGRYRAFSAVCTHSGCIVGNVTGGTINCLCHGSQFNIADGSVVAPPARAPLAPERITVSGADIRRG
jgi:Rieske Fe-S protein